MIPLQNPVPILLPDSVPSVRDELGMLASLPVDELISNLVNTVVNFAIHLGIAIVVFYVGRFIINKLYNLINGVFERRRLDLSLRTFVLSMVRIVLYFILIVTVIGILGIETSSFIAIFASAGVALGMALSGTLQNFAGGVLILLLKPYKIGDYIEAQGYAGTVREIQIFSTIIATPDNKNIIIPNGPLSTGSINNWSRMDYRRVDWIIGISYGDSVEAARKKILQILSADPDVVNQRTEEEAETESGECLDHLGEAMPKPTGIFRKKKRTNPAATASVANPAHQHCVNCEPAVVVSNLGSSSVDLKVTAWVRTPNYWAVYYRINETIYTNLAEAGVTFPFPQLDVHIQNPGKNP